MRHFARGQNPYRLLWAASDAVVWVLAIWFARWLRYDFEPHRFITWGTVIVGVGAALLHLMFGFLIGPYGIGHLRASFEEILDLTKAVLATMVVVLVPVCVASPILVPRSVPVTGAALALMTMFSMRLAVRSWKIRRRPTDGKRADGRLRRRRGRPPAAPRAHPRHGLLVRAGGPPRRQPPQAAAHHRRGPGQGDPRRPRGGRVRVPRRHPRHRRAVGGLGADPRPHRASRGVRTGHPGPPARQRAGRRAVVHRPARRQPRRPAGAPADPPRHDRDRRVDRRETDPRDRRRRLDRVRAVPPDQPVRPGLAGHARPRRVRASRGPARPRRQRPARERRRGPRRHPRPGGAAGRLRGGQARHGVPRGGAEAPAAAGAVSAGGVALQRPGHAQRPHRVSRARRRDHRQHLHRQGRRPDQRAGLQQAPRGAAHRPLRPDLDRQLRLGAVRQRARVLAVR